MELGNPSNGESQEEELENPNNGDAPDDIDSTCSTPYVSAPSSPGRSPFSAGGGGGGGYFFSAPASPMHYVLSSAPYSSGGAASTGGGIDSPAVPGSFEFEFSTREAMISADELFLNGQIRPMKLSSHLQRPQHLAPLMDADEDEEVDETKGESAARGRDLKMRSRSVHRRARSMSPMRNSHFQWGDEEEGPVKDLDRDLDDPDLKQAESDGCGGPTPSSDSASSSRSSSSGRNSKRWIFLKDLLYRSKSEGRGRGGGTAKEKFWHSISFSPISKERSNKPPPPPPASAAETPKPKVKGGGAAGKPTNGVGKRRGPAPSAHERHYTAKRAQAEEMRRKTFLPYRQGLLGCLGFSSRSYGAMNGLAKTLNPVSSR